MMRILVAAILLCCTAAYAEDELDARYQEARRLEANEQYADALKELDAAYALRQPSILLFDLGRLHQKLGHTREAIGYYERYLTADLTLSPEKRAELWAQITELRRLVAPPASDSELPGTRQDVRLVPVRFEVRHDRGLIAGGLSLLLTGYSAAFITGGVFMSTGGSSSDHSLFNASATLLIPVLGPFVSAIVYPSVFWSLPWALVDGAAQVVGLAMTIVGARRKIRVPVFTERLTLAPFSTGNGGGLSASGRF